MKTVNLGYAGRGRLLCAMAAVLSLASVSTHAAFAQAGASAATATPPLKTPEYEVVSVKQNKSGKNSSMSNQTPGGFTMTNTMLISVIRQAFMLYHSAEDQITGLPAWAKSEHFDIQGKVSEADIPLMPNLRPEQHAQMMESLLADRFKMVAHRETKEMPIYALLIGKHGSKLTEAKPDPPPGDVPRQSGCHTNGCMMSNNGHLEARGVPVESITDMLTQITQRTVLDKTSLPGKYDFTLDWTPAEDSATATATSAPELFTAIQEQLGLRLEAQRGPVDGVVIDHIEEPSAN